MIRITITEAGSNRRGILWEATAMHNGSLFRVRRAGDPIRDVLRAVINGTPGFTDCPWQLLRGTRVDRSGPSARQMAASTVREDAVGIRISPDDPDLRAIYAPSRSSEGGDSGEGKKAGKMALSAKVPA